MPPAGAAETVLGTLGGLLLSVCLLPQLWKMGKTRSAADLSYGWLALYGAGLALNTAYLVLAAAPVGAAFHGVELGLVLLMVAWKAVLDARQSGGGGGGGGGDGDGAGAKAPGSSELTHPPVPPTRV